MRFGLLLLLRGPGGESFHSTRRPPRNETKCSAISTGGQRTTASAPSMSTPRPSPTLALASGGSGDDPSGPWTNGNLEIAMTSDESALIVSGPGSPGLGCCFFWCSQPRVFRVFLVDVAATVGVPKRRAVLFSEFAAPPAALTTWLVARVRAGLAGRDKARHHRAGVQPEDADHPLGQGHRQAEAAKPGRRHGQPHCTGYSLFVVLSLNRSVPQLSHYQGSQHLSLHFLRPTGVRTHYKFERPHAPPHTYLQTMTIENEGTDTSYFGFGEHENGKLDQLGLTYDMEVRSGTALPL